MIFPATFPLQVLCRRFEPLEKARIKAGLPFKYFELVCDGCGARLREDAIEKLSAAAVGWYLGPIKADYCPACRPYEKQKLVVETTGLPVNGVGH